MANRVDFNLNVGGKFYRIVYALPKDPYALSGIFLALKENVSRITNEPNPEIFLADGHCKTAIASTCDVLTAIGNAKMNKRPSEQLCVNLFVADPQIKKLKDLLAKKEEENSKLAATLDSWKEVYARLYDRERKSISCLKEKVKQLESKAAILEENVMKVESENQALKLENYELEAFLQRCHITQRKHLADIEQLAMRMDTLENRELNEDINEEAAECEGGWVSEADYAGEKVDQASGDGVEEDRQEDINRDNQEEEDSENEEMEESERKIAEKMAELAAVPFWNSMASFSMKMESIREKIKKIGEKVDVIEENEDNLDEHVNRVEERLNKAVKRVEENKEVLL